MKKSKFSESQIVKILQEAEGGIPVEELSRQHGFSKATFYKWKAKYGGMSVSEVKRMKELEAENRRAKGLSQEELAAATGLHRTYIGVVERGERNTSIVNLTVIAKALGVSLSELLQKVD